MKIHIGCVALSAAGFILRGYWMAQASPRLHRPLVRVLPHVIDTVLLASAIGLVLVTRQYPFSSDWLTAKVFGLIAYIGLGTVALKRGRTRGIRLAAFVMALLVLIWIVSVAITRNPRGMLGLLMVGLGS